MSKRKQRGQQAKKGPKNQQTKEEPFLKKNQEISEENNQKVQQSKKVLKKEPDTDEEDNEKVQQSKKVLKKEQDTDEEDNQKVQQSKKVLKKEQDTDEEDNQKVQQSKKVLKKEQDTDEEDNDEQDGKDDDGQKDENKEDESNEEQEGKKILTKKDEKKLRKELKLGRITRENFEKAMGTFVEVKVFTEEEILQKLNDESNKSAIIAVKEKKVVDSRSKDVKVESFTLAYKSMTLLRDADLTISHGRKYGLIGPNGTGKSTLLRHISQRHLSIPEHIQILHVEQEIEGTDQIALDAVLEADVERSSLLVELEKLQPLSEKNTEEGFKAQDRCIEIHKRLRAIGAHSAEARAAAILAGLQFTVEMQKKKTKEFSGGWRMRISLARALFVLPDLLLLDEPTNHLDLDAVIWLEAYLKRYKKTLLLVSHDRNFLNGVVTDIISLQEQKLVYYKGNYDNYEYGKNLLRKQQLKAEKIQEKKKKEIQEKQDKNSRDKKKKMEKEPTVKVGKEYSVKFIFRDPGPLGYPVIQIKGASFGYIEGEENLLFKNLELNLDLASRVAIVGPNGAGKSTLMNMILGELQPTKGEILRNRHLRVAKFSQHFVDQLTMTDTPVEYIMKKFPEMKQQEARNKLGMFNLKGGLHNQPITLLSGGQKSRVAMAEIGLKTPHMFFLDEPTNHLDIESVDALSHALQEFKGGIILITHDQRLVSTVANELWVCRGDGSVEIYDGSFDEYKQEIIDKMPDELFIDSDDE